MHFFKKVSMQVSFFGLLRRAGGLSLHIILTPGKFPRDTCAFSKTEAKVLDTFHGKHETSIIPLSIPKGILVSRILL